MKKQRQESADLYKKGERQELSEIEESEIKIIDTFLPKQLGEEETRKICKEDYINRWELQVLKIWEKLWDR